jgi:hypothetical protein
MADVSDVENALVSLIVAFLYPNGPSAVSTVQVPVKVFRGLPSNSLLLDDRANGVLDVSVFPVAGTTRNTTRWGVQVFEMPATPTLTVATGGNCATFSGVASGGEVAGILADQTAYIYRTQAGDTAALVAAMLAQAIRINTACLVMGPTLTLPKANTIVGRTAAPATAIEEWGRQEQDFKVSVWAPNPTLRDLAAASISASLATVAFLTLSDGTGGRMRYHAAASIDEDQGSSIYRRDMTYTVEYATTISVQNPTVLFCDLGWNGTTILV